ncbi:MAG: NIPSNAP family protein [Planctomycetaceae bacterium]|nr:NIPSNAP family protein [Planctomycetaceae bacterium]
MRCASIVFFGLVFLGLANVRSEDTSASSGKQSPMLFELRTYTAEPGKLNDLHARFRDHTIRLFEKHGMVNLVYGVPADTPDTLVYLLAHKDRESAEKSWAAFRNDPEWQAAYKKSHENGPLVKKAEAVYFTPTDYSPVKAATKAKSKPEGEPRLYELRIYTTNEGKLANLNARFRDHTIKLFEKHGMKNDVYGVPTEEKTKDNTLVYFVIHKDKAAADKSWADFQNDPDWKAARDASEKDGKILVPGGVKRWYLTPTDYSPVK